MQEVLIEKLIKKIDNNCINVNKDIIYRSYELASKAHKDQRRESGEPYIIHPVEVACILADMGMDTSAIAAGLLHDVIEDTDYTYDDMAREFGSEVANLVEGVTKLGEIEFKSKQEQQVENVRKMLMAMAKDVRVILIKLADRMHNMRTLKYMSVEKQKEKAKETFDIYAPLAHRLGIFKVKWELEDLSFRYTNPNEYYDLVRKIAEKRIERESYIKQIVEELNDNLEKASVKAEIDGRPKHFYSIYKKMMDKSKTLDQIFDLTAVRILVDTVNDCYTALGIVHTIYKPIPGRFKDYIAMPKPNMYQSLHSTVIGPQGKPFEIQIRTKEMHRTAEYGIAAHWKYKELPNQQKTGDSFDLKLTWLRELIEWQRETSDAEEFIESFKIDLFSDEVFVFTPKGTVINLPREATPIDFAYKIHTDIGNRCVGAKVDGKMVPLDYNLKTGEIVEVLTSPIAKGPSIDWINIVKSNQAKSKIKGWFKKAKREENIEKGKDLLEKEAKKQGFNFGEVAKGEGLELALRKYNMNGIDDIYAAVGVGDIISSSIILRLKEYVKKNDKTIQTTIKAEVENINKKMPVRAEEYKSTSGVTVKGVSNILVRYAKCCNPIPGDEIIGYITRGRGVSVHRKDCVNLKNIIAQEGNDKIIEVDWGNESTNDYVTQIQITGEDRPRFLTEIMDIFTERKTYLNSINASTDKNGNASIYITLKISDSEDLKSIMKKIRHLDGVFDVFRTNK